MRHTGHIKLHRAIQDNPLYLSEPFTKVMAWIDLLLNAKYEDEVERHRGSEVAVKRGQLVVSIGELARKWRWTRSKVQRFLDYLERENAIERPIQSAMQNPIQSAIQLRSLISIVNYEKYQTTDTKCDTKCDTHIKEDKKIININNNISPPLSNESVTPLKKRRQDFYDSLIPFVERYGKEMIRDFYDYWSEADRAVKPRMRFEKEKSWELDRRLGRWARNNSQNPARERPRQQARPSKLDQYKEIARQIGIYQDGTEQSDTVDEQ